MGGRKSARFVEADQTLITAINAALDDQGLGPTMLPVSPKTFYRIMQGGSVNIDSVARLVAYLGIDENGMAGMGYKAVAAEMTRQSASYTGGLKRAMAPR